MSMQDEIERAADMLAADMRAMMPEAIAQSNLIATFMNASGLKPGAINTTALLLLACSNARRKHPPLTHRTLDLMLCLVWDLLESGELGTVDAPTPGAPS